MARVTWSATARFEFELTIRRMGRQSLRSAERWGERVRESLAVLEQFPEIGSPVEDSRHAGLRERLVGAYRLIYRYDGADCRIVGCIPAKADADRLLDLDELP